MTKQDIDKKQVHTFFKQGDFQEAGRSISTYFKKYYSAKDTMDIITKDISTIDIGELDPTLIFDGKLPLM